MFSNAFLTGGQFAAAALAIAGFLTLMWKVFQIWHWLKPPKKNGRGRESLYEVLATIREQQIVHGSVAQVIDLPVMWVNADGQIADVNVAFRRLVGYSKDDLQNGVWREKLHGQSRSRWDDAVRSNGLFDHNVQLSTRSGIISAWLLAHPIEDGTRFLGWRCALDRVKAIEDDLS